MDDAIAEAAPKIAIPRDAAMEPAGERTALYSDIDIVGHTNNVRYMVWAMDCLPMELAQKPVRDAYINFNKETKPGDTIRLYRLCGPADCLVEGRDPDGKSCFVVKLVF